MRLSYHRNSEVYHLELGHNAVEATKNIGYTIDNCVYWSRKILEEQARSGMSKTMDSDVEIEAMEANPASRISQYCAVRHIHDLDKSIRSSRILSLTLPKY